MKTLSEASSPLVDVTPIWARLNDSFVRLVDRVPDDKLNWSPKPELWNIRGILLHTIAARDNWLGRDIKDGVATPDVLRTVRSKAELQEGLVRTWRRLEMFLRDQAKVDATYVTPWETTNGHWLAFHALEHDIHHRADIFHYLTMLGIETPDVDTP